jgi:hypothetical protein
MVQQGGFFGLQKPQDLLRKLEHDYARMQQEPLDSYSAFDFFVGAWHMLDWVLPGDMNAKRRTSLQKKTPLLQVCSELANNSKHLELRGEPQSYHHQVQRPGAAVGRMVIGVSRIGTSDGLEIQLRPYQAKALGVADYIDALDLAGRLLVFWREYLWQP